MVRLFVESGSDLTVGQLIKGAENNNNQEIKQLLLDNGAPMPRERRVFNINNL